MEKSTEKFIYDDIACSSPWALASLVRESELAKDGDKFKFQGCTLVAHTLDVGGICCSDCCFEHTNEICDFVSCVPEERRDGNCAWFTLEPAGKGVSHE